MFHQHWNGKRLEDVAAVETSTKKIMYKKYFEKMFKRIDNTFFRTFHMLSYA